MVSEVYTEDLRQVRTNISDVASERYSAIKKNLRQVRTSTSDVASERSNLISTDDLRQVNKVEGRKGIN